MSTKYECPACLSYSSDVWRAFTRDEPCPQCGLPSETVDALERTLAEGGPALQAYAREMTVRAMKAVAALRAATPVVAEMADLAEMMEEGAR